MCKRTTAVPVYPDSSPAQQHCERDWVSLCDESEKDEPWDTHRARTDAVSAVAARAGLDRMSVRLRDCAESLFFKLRPDPDTGEILWKLHSAPFCHNRHCSVCNWRRSLRLKAIMLNALPHLMEKYPTARWAFLGLTVRNCPVGELRDTIKAMNKGYQRLIQRKDWPALGWVRALEVTANVETREAHPHFHVLLMVPSGYFSGKSYVKTAEWVQRWRQAMRLDYDPECDIRSVKPKHKLNTSESADITKAMYGAVSEVLKYSTKDKDLLAMGPQWFAVFVQQVRGTKIVTSGGALRGILKAMAVEDDAALVHTGEDEDAKVDDDDDDERLVYHWRRAQQHYQRRKREYGGM